MPRYRTISCQHCGYLQLKRDATCDQCGAFTARERERLIAKGIFLLIVLVFAAIAWVRFKAVLVGLGAV